MKARKVHAIMAAGLADPCLLNQWRHNPEMLRDLGIEPSEINLETLWRFAGLTTKIRHNPLRDDLPLTFQVLDSTGLEIEVFSSYAQQAYELKKAGKKSVLEKTQSLFEFLEVWLDLQIPEHALVWDTIRHEFSMAQIRKLAAEKIIAPLNTVSGCELTTDDILVIRGKLLLWEMTFLPNLVAKRLQRRPANFSGLEKGQFWLGYWWNGTIPQVHILDLPEIGFYILSLVDGSRSVEGIATQLKGAGGRLPMHDLLEVLQEFLNLGVVVIRARNRT